MTTAGWVSRYVTPYCNARWIRDERGWLVWRFGTGDNIELLHIRTHVKRRGYGKQMMCEMVEQIINQPPYHSVYGFTRVSNDEARAFYGALGFRLMEVPGIYQDGRAVLFWQSFANLRRQFGL